VSERGEDRRDDPILVDLIARVARLEERVNGVEKVISLLKEKIEALESSVSRIDNRLWYVITGVVLSILVQILLHFLR
jgi:uncharacterized coiled-coil protein SlyX